MSSGQKSLIPYFKRKENAGESDNNSTKKSKINDNSNNIVNDSTTNIQTLSNTEPSCDIQSNINENCSLSITIITTTNDNKKRTYQKWYSDSYKWLIFLCAPISTATVERDCSTMNRILTDLRNRLTTENLEQLMKISIEEPSDLDNDLKDLIIDCWKSKKIRRISV